MKKIVLIAAFSIALSGCKTASDSDSKTTDQVNPDIIENPASAQGDKKVDLPKFDFAETTYDFGTIRSGTEVTHEYKFKNTGDADLIISQAQGSCGCTIPEYPKGPLHAGDDAVIKVTFHSAGLAGQIAKTITILANTIPSTKVLTITGEVIK